MLRQLSEILFISEKEAIKRMGSQACLYQLELGSDKPVKMEVQVPDGMDISKMTCDGKGNLCLLLTQVRKWFLRECTLLSVEAFA